MWFHKADWLDFNSIQSGHHFGSDSFAFVSKDYALTPAKPTVDMEPAYENHPTGANWLYKDGDGPFPKNGYQHWRKAMAYEGATQVGFMRRLFELRPWYKLVPDQSVLASDAGKGSDRVVAARAEDGSFVLAYLPTGKPVSLKMDKLSGKSVKARWYDPRKGTWQEIGAYPNIGTREFIAPAQGVKSDWVLVLDDVAKGYPTEQPK
jgi:hypothetical protein